MNYKVPYDFVLRLLYPVRPVIRKMLGGYSLWVDKKLIMLLREREGQPEFNGIFIATKPEHFEALQKEIYASNMAFDIDGTHNSWLFISEDLDEFEEKLRIACNLIKNKDARIGIGKH